MSSSTLNIFFFVDEHDAYLAEPSVLPFLVFESFYLYFEVWRHLVKWVYGHCTLNEAKVPINQKLIHAKSF